jgi:hypothetical protein
MGDKKRKRDNPSSASNEALEDQSAATKQKTSSMHCIVIPPKNNEKPQEKKKKRTLKQLEKFISNAVLSGNCLRLQFALSTLLITEKQLNAVFCKKARLFRDIVTAEFDVLQLIILKMSNESINALLCTNNYLPLNYFAKYINIRQERKRNNRTSNDKKITLLCQRHHKTMQKYITSTFFENNTKAAIAIQKFKHRISLKLNEDSNDRPLQRHCSC